MLGDIFPARFLVYLNGVRVPASAVQVSYRAGDIMQGSVSLPPHKHLARMGAEDRLQVAVFYLDVNQGEGTPQDHQWSLLCEGEVTGWHYSSNHSSGRQLQLVFRSHLAILHELYLYMLSGDTAARGKRAKSDRNYPNQLKLRGKYPDQLFTQGLSGKGSITRPFDIIENILYAVLGQHREKGQSSKAKSSGGPSAASIDKKLKELKKEQELNDGLLINYQTSGDPVDPILFQTTLDANESIAAEMAKLRSQRAARINQATHGGEFDRLKKNRVLRRERQIKARANYLFALDTNPYGNLADKEKEVRAEIEDKDKKSASELLSFYKSKNLIGNFAPSGKSLEQLEERLLTLQAKKNVSRRGFLSKSVAQTGFFSRYMRLTRFLEKWMASPYLEGRPRAKDPLSGKMGGGVFPILNASKSRKVFRALAKHSGIKYGPQATTFNLIAGIFGSLFYEVSEVSSPPALALDKYGLPKSSFYKRASKNPDTGASSQFDQTENGYVKWAFDLAKAKERLSLGTYLTKPISPFSLPPSCNVVFPSMWTAYSIGENYTGHPTRVYYNRKGELKKLSLGSSLPGYSYDSARVGFPAVVERHVQDASSGVNDLELLVFPEEYYRGPMPALKDAPLMLSSIQSVANSARFGRGEFKREDTPAIQGGTRTSNNPVYAETMAFSLKAIERANKRGHSMQALYFLLAAQEYYNSKYVGRNGRVEMLFNPYILCNHPLAVFDSSDKGVHMLGRVAEVQHSLSADGFGTSVSFTHGRTFEEMFTQMYADGPGLDMSPMSPISEERDLLQYIPQANAYYTQLFYQDSLNDNDSDSDILDYSANNHDETRAGVGVFDYRQWLGWDTEAGPDNDRIVNRPDAGTEIDLPSATYNPPHMGLMLHTSVAPLSRSTLLFSSAEYAFRFVARPVCSLEQYIDLYGVAGRGDSNADPIGRGRGIRVRVRKEDGLEPLYYDIIRQFVGGPGVEPGSKISDAIADPSNPDKEPLVLTVVSEDSLDLLFSEVAVGQKALFQDLPDSRRDWQRLLLAYLRIVDGDGEPGTLAPPLE